MGFNNIIKPKISLDEALFTRIGNNLLGNLYVADKDGNIVFCNNSCAETFECSMEKLYGTNVHDLYSSGLTDRESASSEVLTTKKPLVRFIRTGNGVGMLIYGKPVFDENGEIEMSVCTTYVEANFMEFISKIDEDKSRMETALEFINRDQSQLRFLKSENFKMQEVYNIAGKAAKAESIIIIYGESGVGKEIMAKFIHSQSGRVKSIFLPVNCAAIPTELLESEFFGYEKGAFTGANERGKQGLIEMAHNGTLFLDEIGELPLNMQSKFLRVLESGELRRVGGSKSFKVNVRVIAATNRDLWGQVKRGTFREDLFYRLNVVPIKIPPLRERPEDIIPLANHFLKLNNRKYHTAKRLSPQTYDYFLDYRWPGNIRELRNIIERMSVVSKDSIMDIYRDGFWDRSEEDVEPVLSAKTDAGQMFSSHTNAQDVLSYGDTLKNAVAAFEREYIHRVLDACGGNITAAAKRLDIHRSNLYKTMERIK